MSRPTIIRASRASVASAAGIVSTTDPRRSTVMRSATSIASRSLWEMNTIDAPCSRSARTMSKSSRVSCGVSTAVGSSSTRISAPR